MRMKMMMTAMIRRMIIDYDKNDEEEDDSSPRQATWPDS